jgi:MFS family permease
LTVLLERQGTSATLIGLNAAMPVLAVIAAARMLPEVARRWRMDVALIAGLIVISAGTLLLPVFTSYGAWLVLRFLIGIGGSLHWIASETWINMLAPPGRRGLYVGLYGALYMSGFATGPLLLSAVPIEGWLPFLFVAGAVLIAAGPLTLARGRLPPIDPPEGTTSWSAFLIAPTAILATIASGLGDGALWALIPIYGLAKGCSEQAALLMLTALNIGTFLLQVPLGLLADRFGTRTMMTLIAIGGVAGGLALPQLIEAGPVLWPMLFLWGGAMAGLYSLALARLGERFEGPALAQANATFISCYSIGGLVGPPGAGAAMDRWGPDGLPYGVALVTGAFLIFAIARTLQPAGRRSR